MGKTNPKEKEKAAAAPAKGAKGAPVVPAAPVKASVGKGGKGAPVPEPVEEKPAEKKKEKKSQKERPHSKKKHKNVQIWKLYKIEGNKLIRKNETCPRCSAGTFLAKYKNRKYCGKCGWSEIVK